MLGRAESGGAAGRSDRRSDLLVAEAAGAGGGRQLGEGCFVAGFGGAAGGPEQAVVAIALVLLLDPGGQVPHAGALSTARLWGAPPLGFEDADDRCPVQP